MYFSFNQRNPITPARLSLHILQATKYYIEDQTETKFGSGKCFDVDSATVKDNDLPSRKDILKSIDQFSIKTEKWLTKIDYLSTNDLMNALSNVTNQGTNKIDVLYLDACLMNMLEVAYQVRDYGDYLFGNENLGWATIPPPYDDYIDAVGSAMTWMK